MTTITLKPDLTRQIEHFAGTNQTQKDAFIDKAVRQYIAQIRRDKIRAETESFTAQYETLLSHYLHQYVALHNGQVIDHDPDLRALHLRVFARLGNTPVLLKQVTHSSDRELIFRSPRLETNAT
ncbi:MAG: hypothetical protein IAE79_23185 [Anaerolinea sp.]|nr:hypothetical protein [Anaerolinea sp.]